MELFLIRHGQSLNNAADVSQRVPDAPLTDVGLQQASRCAQWVPSLELSRLVSSPFLRALQTTDPIRKATGLRPEVQIDLHEVGGCYSGHLPEEQVGLPGMTRSQMAAKFPGFRIAENIDGDGWWACKPFESMEQARDRAAGCFRRTVDAFAHTAERVAYVMHGDYLRCLLNCFHDASLETPFNTSVSKITITPDEARIEYYNRVDHLDAELLTI
jgi:2,3-bisphosphoglycerate-dependent phosphoglycerate mutase